MVKAKGNQDMFVTTMQYCTTTIFHLLTGFIATINVLFDSISLSVELGGVNVIL